MRRGFKCWEFYSSLILIVLSWWYLKSLERSIAISAISNAYLVSRFYCKRFQARKERSWATTEIWINLLAQGFSFLTFKLCWYLPLINHVFFLIFRGRIKGRDQTFIHVSR
jgi:hypothetical protein